MRLALVLAALLCSAHAPVTPVQRMRQSTVKIVVNLFGSTDGLSVDTTWAGSGVVYEKSDGSVGPVKSHILTANHVLDVPANFKGAVTMLVLTEDGRTCSLTPLMLGYSDTRDVATAEADCDAGRVAKIAKAVPPQGTQIFVSGHPLGFEMSIVTSGFFNSWYEGYELLSAPSAPGNSGGPVFNGKGEVVGLLVRGSREYSELTLGAPLSEVQARVWMTPSF